MYQYIFLIDNAVHNFFITNSSPSIFRFFIGFTLLGEIKIIPIILLAIVLLSFARPRFLFFIVGSLIVGGVVSGALKYLVARARPPEILYGVLHTGFSFPSNHALMAVVFYGFIGYWCYNLFHKKWQKAMISVLTIFLILAIGISRLALNVHWLSDVLAGWFLGVIVLTATIRLRNRYMTSQESKNIR